MINLCRRPGFLSHNSGSESTNPVVGPPSWGVLCRPYVGEDAQAEASAIKAAFVRGEQCPHGEMDVPRHSLGNRGREGDRLYGVYKETVFARRSATALPDSCILPVSVGEVVASVVPPAVPESERSPALGEGLAVTFLLPEEYHGVVIQYDPGRPPPPRAVLASWWREMSKRVRDLHLHKAIPTDLKAALKGGDRSYTHRWWKSRRTL